MFYSSILFVYKVKTNDDTCCKKKTVSNKGPGFDGVYVLKDDLPEDKPHEMCADNCLYTKHESEGDFCFQQVEVSEGADIVCETENTTTTIQPTTTNIEIQVQTLNNSISEKRSKKTELIEKKEIARNASKAVENINNALQTLTKRKRQADGSTLPPITTCIQFSTHYNQLLDILTDGLKEEEINIVNELVRVLTDIILTINDLCSETEKSNIKVETEGKVETANNEVTKFVVGKEQEIVELEEEINDLTEELEEILQSTTPSSIRGRVLHFWDLKVNKKK